MMYQAAKKYLVSQDKLEFHNYPVRSNGRIVLKNKEDKFCSHFPSSSTRNCFNCYSIYAISSTGEDISKTPCMFHYDRFPRYAHKCCGRTKGSPECETRSFHMHGNIDADNLTGFISTDQGSLNEDIYAMDCEMAMTSEGWEAVLLSMVDINCDVVMEKLFKPKGKIYDYKTYFSGLKESDFRDVTATMDDVHAEFLRLVGPNTILVGHALQNDLLTFKVHHTKIIDTSILFPHSKGFPFRQSLSYLHKNELGSIRVTPQDSKKSTEDAALCMKLLRKKCNQF